MKLLRPLAVLVVCAGLVGSACGSTDAVAATVNGRNIDRASFERELKALRDNKQLQEAGGEGLSGTGRKSVSAELAAGWLTALIYDALITAEFERRHLKESKADKEAAAAQLATQFGNSPRVAEAFPQWFRDRLVGRNTRAVAVRRAVSGLDTSEAALHKYYEDHKAELEQACLSHILVKTKEEADAVVARVRAGEDFAAVATQTSQDPGSAPKGGDLGCNPKGAFVPEFDAAAFSLPLNTVSDPVQTQFGFHVLLIKERKTTPFDQARSQLKTALNSESQNAFRTFLEKAARKAKVTVDARYGKFEAREGQAPTVVPPEVPSPAEGRPQKGGDTGTPLPSIPGETPSTPPSG